MKRAFLLIAGGWIGIIAGGFAILAGVIVLIRNLPAGLGDRLLSVPRTMAGRIVEHMPDG